MRSIEKLGADWSTVTVDDDIERARGMGRSITLRLPRMDGETVVPGVLLIKYTNTFRHYARRVDLARLQRFFHLVLEPSWAGYALPEILAFARLPRPVIIQATYSKDREFISGLGSSLRPVPFGSSNWVDHRRFRPTNESISYDVAYVANYTRGKRVHVFFRALRRLRIEGHSVRAALICARWGGQREVAMDMMRYYDVEDCIDLFESLTQAEVSEVLNRSRCNVLLSLKEGSNRSLFEAMFAGTPAILIEENVGVNHDYITAENGLVVPEAQLAEAILRMREIGPSLRPREWAMEHIAPEVTTRRLEESLRREHGAAEAKYNPGSSLWVKVNVPEAQYFEEARHPIRNAISSQILDLFSHTVEETDSEIVSAIRAAATQGASA